LTRTLPYGVAIRSIARSSSIRSSRRTLRPNVVVSVSTARVTASSDSGRANAVT
jgi:hypothetical protein